MVNGLPVPASEAKLIFHKWLTVIIFLDFDGVLHPDAAFLINGRPTLKGEGRLFMWAPLLVNVLADFPEAKIVLSTSWARELSFSRARRWLPPALRPRVIGATWHTRMSLRHEGFRSVASWWDGATRYEQIKRYASRAGRTDWIAIDDQPEGWGAEDLGKLVHTHGDTGLSDARALALLVELLKTLRDAVDSKLLADGKRAIFATMRTDPPLPDDAKHWIKTHDTQTGQITWTRRDLSEEWQRLQFKIRGIDQPSEAGDPC